jgi:hypothetical protein
MPITRGVYHLWVRELQKVRTGEEEVKKFENMMTEDGVGHLSMLLKNKLFYTSEMGIFGFTGENPRLDDMDYVETLIREAMVDTPMTSAQDSIKSWFEDMMEASYCKASIYMNVIPFEGPCQDNVMFKDPATVPLTFKECFPTIFEWTYAETDKTRKRLKYVAYPSPTADTSNYCYDSPNYINSPPTKGFHPATPRKAMPPYWDKASSYDSPSPTPVATKPPPVHVRTKHTTPKVARVLLWGDAGGNDGYGGGM